MPDARFTEDHLWIRMRDGVATVGLTRFAVQALGEVTVVRLPQPGRRLQAGENCGDVETTKAASEIQAPVGGTVVQANDALAENPAPVNADPEGDGWLFQVAPSGPGLERLMDRAAYAAFTGAL